jgi:ABC-type nitrate/sulfonate/bicarbonate transport system substrate-binding protein
MERFRGTAVMSIVLLIMIAGLSARASAQTKKIRMGISALSAGYTVAYIAKDTGLFAKNGLDLELILIDSGPTVHALIAEDLSVAGVGASRIVASGLQGSTIGLAHSRGNQ